MATTNGLSTRLEAEFAEAHDRVRHQAEEFARDNAVARQRFDTFARVRDKVRELAAPRLQLLGERIPDGKMKPVPSPHGGSVTVQLDTGLASITLSFALSHEGTI